MEQAGMATQAASRHQPAPAITQTTSRQAGMLAGGRAGRGWAHLHVSALGHNVHQGTAHHGGLEGQQAASSDLQAGWGSRVGLVRAGVGFTQQLKGKTAE